ncbi:MAG: 7-cyano-7-deazaguanine synthase QueC [Pseudomonadota bacterium]
MQGGALVLFSGGQDSTTCLGWALERYERVETIGFDYGQRHRIEMDCRRTLLERIRADFPDWAKRLGDDVVVPVEAIGALSATALTREVEMEMGADGLPNTFVPGRNLIFLSFAAAYAYRRGLKHIVTGVCETDYSGYPDCRDDTIKAMQVALNLGLARRFVLETPLMWNDKAQTFALARELGGQAFLDLVVAESHSCYAGDRSKLHDWGRGCGTCPACQLRGDGWRKFLAEGL